MNASIEELGRQEQEAEVKAAFSSAPQIAFGYV